MPDGGLPGDATALRLRLLANGWVPVPITAPDHRHPEVKSPGKQPFLPRWQTFTRETLDEATVRGWARLADQPGTGLVCGRLVVADLDAPVEEVAERLKATAFALLGPSPSSASGAPRSWRSATAWTSR